MRIALRRKSRLFRRAAIVIAALLMTGFLSQAIQPAQAPRAYAAPRLYPENLPSQFVHPGSVLIAFRQPVKVTGTHIVPSGSNPAAGADVASFNLILDSLHVSTITHLFGGLDANKLNASRARAEAATHTTITDFTQVYLLSFDKTINDGAAANRLGKSPLLSTAAPNFIYQQPAHETAPAAAKKAVAQARAAGIKPSVLSLPANYGYTSDAQSYHDASTNDVTGAFAMIADKYGKMPAEGEYITNISLGTIDDSSTVTESGQRYLEYAGFPKIPVWLSSGPGPIVLDPTANNTADGQGDLGEVMLDFSVMAPPPNGDPRIANPQTPGTTGNILGAAYGASFRLINPLQNGTPDFIAAWLGAGQQSPAPDVITASIGNGLGALGFSDYSFEQETLIHDAVTMDVYGGSFVTISAGDGQTNTDAAMNPNGVVGKTELTTNVSLLTDLDATNFANPAYSYFISHEAQYLTDSGAVDAGADTLNDIFNNNPQNTTATDSHTQHTTETRFTGQQNFHTGNGSRVDLSAPGDDVLYLAQDPTAVTNTNIADEPELIGGTSASCPEIAAAAAVVRQVSKLVGVNSGAGLGPVDTRALLIATGRPHVAPTFDLENTNIGPELDLTAAVTKLYRDNTVTGTPSLVRMTVAERKAVPYSNGYARGFYTDVPQDATAGTATIDLSQGLAATSSFNLELAAATGDNLTAPLTFAVDGAYLPASTTYSWTLQLGAGATVSVPAADFDSTLPYLRLLPSEIFSILSAPVTAASDRVVTVTATTNGSLTKAMAVTFKGQSDSTYTHAMAPSFNPVFKPLTATDGVTVSYDLTGLRDGTATPGATVDGGVLIISDINRTLPRAFSDRDANAHGCEIKLTGLTGTIKVTPTTPCLDSTKKAPHLAMPGGVGTYGVALRGTKGGTEVATSVSSWIPLRYAPQSAIHPATPKVLAKSSYEGAFQPVYWDIVNTKKATINGTTYAGSTSFTVTYDTSAVTGAVNTLIEFSAPSADLVPPFYVNGTSHGFPMINNFTNPTGDRLDAGNHLGQPGSVSHKIVKGVSGTAKFTTSGAKLKLAKGTCDEAYQVRVFAVDKKGKILGVASYTSIIDVANLTDADCTA